MPRASQSERHGIHEADHGHPVRRAAPHLLRRAQGGEDRRHRPTTSQLRDIKRVGVIGAGTMGGGISMNFLSAGIPVTIVEMAQEALDRGTGTIRKNYEATAAKGRMTRRAGRGGDGRCSSRRSTSTRSASAT